MKVRVVMNTQQCVARFSPRYRAAQKWLDNEVLKDCEPYVPFRTGNLARSGPLGTKLGSGKVIYNAPYARRVYYARGTKFSKQKHPQACAEWFEKAKAVRLKHWTDGVEKMVKGE